MSRKALTSGAALVTLLLSLIGAAGSIAGPDLVERLAGSWWFIGLAAVVAAGSLFGAIIALARRGWSRVTLLLIHAGVVVGLAGVLLNQTAVRPGYLFLEAGAGDKDFGLDRTLQKILPLPFAVRLDSMTERVERGFLPAPVAWVSSGDASRPVGYNRPLRVAGRRLVFGRLTDPGFPHEYELSIGSEHYLLLHNQQVRLDDGSTIASFGFDTAEGTLGISAGGEQVWLRPGDSTVLAGRHVRLESVAWARRAGAIFVVQDGRLRPLLFAGFGLALLGIALHAFRKEAD